MLKNMKSWRTKAILDTQINVKSEKAWIDKQCSEGYYTPCQDGCWVVELGRCGKAVLMAAVKGSWKQNAVGEEIEMSGEMNQRWTK